MTTVKIEAVFEAMPENELQASLLIANELLCKHSPSTARVRETMVAHKLLPDNPVQITVHMPQVYTVIGFYEDNGQTYAEALTGHTPAEAAENAPDGVRIIGSVLGDVEVL